MTIAIAALALVVPASAAAEAPRQTFTATFTTPEPGASAGLTLEIDYVNPADPEAKPPAVAEVVIQAPQGAAVDTSVPPRCDVPDPLVMLLGAGACPEGSVVGRGDLVLDTGLILSENDITLINATDKLIFVTRPKGVPIPGGLVTPTSVENGTFRTAVPPIPGLPPPDIFTALDHVRLELDERTTAAGSYITTPPGCPAEGAWTTVATFTYRDGVTQSAAATSPCQPAALP
ncbi:MAG: hypothetical protein WD844_07465 [Thermoleophilaceae bacterium]